MVKNNLEGGLKRLEMVDTNGNAKDANWIIKGVSSSIVTRTQAQGVNQTPQGNRVGYIQAFNMIKGYKR